MPRAKHSVLRAKNTFCCRACFRPTFTTESATAFTPGVTPGQSYPVRNTYSYSASYRMLCASFGLRASASGRTSQTGSVGEIYGPSAAGRPVRARRRRAPQPREGPPPSATRASPAAAREFAGAEVCPMTGPPRFSFRAGAVFFISQVVLLRLSWALLPDSLPKSEYAVNT